MECCDAAGEVSIAGQAQPCRVQAGHQRVLGGEAPAFVRAESPRFSGGPLWRIELVPRPCGDEPIVAKLPSRIIDTKGPVDGAPLVFGGSAPRSDA